MGLVGPTGTGDRLSTRITSDADDRLCLPLPGDEASESAVTPLLRYEQRRVLLIQE